MKRFFSSSVLLLALVAAALAFATAGCSTTEAENASSRPWNSPRGWETGGLPSTLNEGR